MKNYRIPLLAVALTLAAASPLLAQRGGAAGAPALPVSPASVMPKEPDAASIARNAKIPLPKLIPADRKKVEWLLRSLAHDSMEGRGTGTPGGDRAARFIAAQMKSAGIKPAGDSAFFQMVPMRMTIPVPGGRGGAARVANMAALDTVPVERRIYAKNVLGIIPGTDPVLKDEVVIVLSHYDHLGRTGAGSCRPIGADSICNGADDDASGTVGVLEVARHLAKSKPKRTIMFATMTGEETGMIGTNYYIANPRLPLEKLVAGLEIEMIGRSDSLAGGPGKAWLTGYERSTMGDMLQEFGIAIVPDARPSQSFFTRSDNAALARRGIVAHTLSTFNLHTQYHTAWDESDLMDFDHMTHVIASAVEAVKHLANGPKPAWHEGGDPSKFSAPPRAGRGGAPAAGPPAAGAAGAGSRGAAGAGGGGR